MSQYQWSLKYHNIKSIEDIIKEEDKYISELKEAFSSAQSQITFLEWENIELKMNQLL